MCGANGYSARSLRHAREETTPPLPSAHASFLKARSPSWTAQQIFEAKSKLPLSHVGGVGSIVNIALFQIVHNIIVFLALDW